jgi:hypothetical protein
MAPICDRCDNDIVDNDTYFRCEFCHYGDFDICQSCFDIGERCHVQCHYLFHLALQGEISIDLATVKVYYGRCRSHSKYLPFEWENQKNTSGCIDDQFPQTRHEYESLPAATTIGCLRLGQALITIVSAILFVTSSSIRLIILNMWHFHMCGVIRKI